MATVLQPRSASTDVISRYKTMSFQMPDSQWTILTALAADFNEDREVGRSLAVPRSERLQELETVAFRVDGDLDAETILRRRLEGILTGIITTRRKLISTGVGEFKGFAIRASQGVCKGIEGEATSKGHGGDDIRRGNEGVGRRVGIITSGEVAIVGCNDFAKR